MPDLRIQINIIESPETLLELLAKQTNKYCYLKVQMLYILKTGQAITLKEIAQQVKVDKYALKRWINTYNESGIHKLIKNPNESKVPQWAIEPLCEELKTVQFTPNAKTVQSWFKSIGYPICRDVASTILYSLIPEISLFKQQKCATPQIKINNTLSIDETIYQELECWKKEHNIVNDGEALNKLMAQFFKQGEKYFLPDSSHSEPSIKDDSNKNIKPPLSNPSLLNQTQLAIRLKVTNGTLSIYRDKAIFSRWTQQKDPDNLAWEWVSKLKKYEIPNRSKLQGI